MAVVLNQLYDEFKEKYSLSWVAGKEGRGHAVRSVYIAEDLDNASFLKGGELVITTGMEAGRRRDWILHLLETLITRKSSGLILNLGKYLDEKDITADLIEFCEKKEFPVLTMPWEVHISDVTQNFWNRILQTQQKEDRLGQAVKELIYASVPEADAEAVLQENAFFPDDRYRIGLLMITDVRNTEYPQFSARLKDMAAGFFSDLRDSVVFFLIQGMAAMIWKNSEETRVRKRLLEITEKIKPSLSGMVMGDFTIVKGIGESEEGYAGIRKSYQQAFEALKTARFRRKEILFYRELGPLQIFLQVQDRNVLKDFEENQIGILEKYDWKRGTEMVETLRQFLVCEGRLQDTADALHCHRNTVVYRIGKIQELLGRDLRDGEACYMLHLALEIRDFFRIFV